MTEQIKQRIEMINRGEVPERYIHTREGIFPCDWGIKQINKWIKLCERTIKLQDEMSYELITVRRAYKGVDSRGNFFGKEILVKNYFVVHNFDFVISKRQIAHGACGIVPKELDNAVVSNEYNVFIAQDSTDINMFNLMMQLPHYNRLFYLMSDGVHIEKLLFKTNDWLKRKLAMPPLPEQEKIAEILTTQDKVIELKQKLINEKKQQKKWLMQQLLTGKIRLKGFSGEWKKVRLGEVCECIRGVSYKPENLYLSDNVNTVRLLRSNNIGTGNININDLQYVDSSKVKETQILINGDIVVCMANGSKSLVGKNGVFINKDGFRYTCGAFCAIIRFNNLIMGNYGNQIFQSDLYFFEISNSFEGSNINNLKNDDILEMRVILPPLPEQTAISEILSTQDKEIELLEKDLEQEKQKKKALMQLLLTGKVRVNV